MSVPASFIRLHEEATRRLRDLEPWDQVQHDLRDRMLDHLRAHPDAMWREGPSDHFTASAMVFDRTGSRVLLVLHRKALLWLQPGGHFEAGDTGVEAAALREVLEETGVTADPAHQLTQLDHHSLPSSFGRCTSHLDIRIVATARQDDLTLSDESHDVQWWPVDALPEPTDSALPAIIEQGHQRACAAGVFDR